MAQEALENRLREASSNLNGNPDTTFNSTKKDQKNESKERSKKFRTSDKMKENIQVKASTKDSSQKHINPTKNIIINYGRAIVTFALSRLSKPYIESDLIKEGVNLEEFTDFILETRGIGIGSIHSFRSMLLINEKDSAKVAIFKKLFMKISEVFIKYFSVNWIIHGRVNHKLVYLKYRYKMLRRIQNPEHFTYVK